MGWSRLPTQKQVISTVGLLTLFVFTWSVKEFFFRLPSYVLHLDLLTLGGVFAYYMAFALLECAILTLILTLISVALPSNWYARKFDILNLPIVSALAVSAYLFQGTIDNSYPGADFFLIWAGGTAIVVALLAFLFSKENILKRLAEKILDSVTIMTYVYIPIGIISLVVVLFRLVF